ncbi:zinc finger protein SHOOT GRAVITROPISM 5 [Heracleum sosnowskyi]|uniref:Zinc finger protein SHOOT GRAVITROPISM 5 n=1 Tax=Heracleum sosnowskyi TaxID=360622 RepID=A0AAD8I2G6_9APIA|nr:zinc finger protein SHOOT GRAVITROPISM 5 [Heracleum sosnowskyi]
MDMEEDHQELQLLPSPNYNTSSNSLHTPSWPSELSSYKKYQSNNNYEQPSLDLQLSVPDGLETLKWQATEQTRLAALEKAYVERVRDLTRRELEMAQSEFSRARLMWERAREEVEQAEKLKHKSMRWISPTCMEITCQSCRKKFRS